MNVQALEVRTAGELEETFTAMVRERPGELLVMADRLFLYKHEGIMDFATTQRLPGGACVPRIGRGRRVDVLWAERPGVLLRTTEIIR